MMVPPVPLLVPLEVTGLMSPLDDDVPAPP
jgi:hypothetical protein